MSFFYRILLGLLSLLSVLIIIVLPLALSAVGGNLAAYSGMKLEFFFVTASYILLVPWWHRTNYFLAHDRGSTLMRVSIITSLIGFPIWISMMIFLGELGVYLGFFTLSLIRSVGIVIIASRYWLLRLDLLGIAISLLVPLLAVVVKLPSL